MTRREQLLKYVSALYVPVALREQAAQLMKIIQENDYRAIESKDEGTIHLNALIIETTGRGERETFRGYDIDRIDVGKVGPEMADIAIMKVGGTLAIPKRVNKKNIKINLLQD